METLDVKIGGRSYPLTLSPEEVDVVRAASQAVEAQIAQLKSQYAITDRIDLMAMAALQIAVQAQTNAPQPAKGSADACLLYTSPSPRDISGSRMPSSA